MIFEQAVSLVPASDSTFTWSVPPGWEQGRGAWGGLVVAVIARAVELAQGDPSRPVRSLTCEIPQPVLACAHTVSATCLRRGASASTWRVEIIDGDGHLRAAGTAVTGSARDLVIRASGSLEPPVPPAGVDLPDWGLPVPPGPGFSRALRYRPASGMPVSGSPSATSGWLSFAEPVDWTPAAMFALVDGWWPAALASEESMRPMATVMFSATLGVVPDDLAGVQALWFEGRTTAVSEGFTTESRRLWTPDGRLAVDNLQSIVVIA